MWTIVGAFFGKWKLYILAGVAAVAILGADYGAGYLNGEKHAAQVEAHAAQTQAAAQVAALAKQDAADQAERVARAQRDQAREQDLEGQGALLKQVEMKCNGIKGAREVMSPRQVQVGGNSGVETVAGTGGYFGSVILR